MALMSNVRKMVWFKFRDFGGLRKRKMENSGVVAFMVICYDRAEGVRETVAFERRMQRTVF